jgi:hypothetical protein
MSEPSVAYLSQRKLYIRTNGVTRSIESEFERAVRERSASIERRHAWKAQGRGAMFMGGAWGAQQEPQAEVPVLLTGLTAGKDGSLVYSMESDAVSGLFLVNAGGVETRLFHTADFRVRHASLHADGATVAASALHKDSARSSIVVVPVHGNDLTEVTEGDSFDQFPQWVPGAGKRIVFQSAGVGRDAAGHFAGLGPCTVQTLDLGTGSLEETAAENGRDLLQPRISADGTLYCIRKPYESGIPKPSLLGSLKDTALFPFRMARAVFQYFNIFSMMYTGKPLVTNKGAAQRRIDPRLLFIHGNLAHAQLAQSSGEDEPGLAPTSWELVRRRAGERPEVIATRVVTYDLAPGAGVRYSDGSAIHHLDTSGRSSRILKADQIEQVIAV